MNTEKLTAKQLAKIQAAAESDLFELEDKYRKEPNRKAKNILRAQAAVRQAIIARCQSLRTAAVCLALALLVLSGCSKDEPAAPCTGPGHITLTSRNIIGWENDVPVIFEVKGISWPGHTTWGPIAPKEHRIEGHAMVRIRTECSEWSDWVEINKP